MRIAVLAVALIALMGAVWGIAERVTTNRNIPQIVPHPAGYMLAVSFAHADHVEQNCIECHHNYVDGTGTGMCFDCHKTDATVADLIEEQFHDLCRGCHIEQQRSGAAHGPTRNCLSCHVRDDEP